MSHFVLSHLKMLNPRVLLKFITRISSSNPSFLQNVSKSYVQESNFLCLHKTLILYSSMQINLPFIHDFAKTLILASKFKRFSISTEVLKFMMLHNLLKYTKMSAKSKLISCLFTLRRAIIESLRLFDL